MIFENTYLNLSAAFIIGMTGVAGNASAQAISYPSKPVRVVVPFPAASASDNIGRISFVELSRQLGGSFFADNKPGASGIIGIDSALLAPADGYTLVVSSSSTHSVNPGLFKKLSYDPVNGMTNISCLAIVPQVILVAPDGGYKSLEDLVKFGRSNPGKLAYSYGTPTSQVAGAAVAKLSRFEAVGISYKGASEAMLGLMRGDTQYMLADLSTAISQIKAHKLIALGVSTATGSPQLPGVPSFSDAGLKDFKMILWVGLSGPAKLPDDITRRIAEGLRKGYEQPEVKAKFAEWGIERCANGQAAFEKLVSEQVVEWRDKIKELGIPAQ